MIESHLVARRLPVGAEIVRGGVHFRVWAPRRERVDVVIESDAGAVVSHHALRAEGDGYFSGRVAGARAGTLYRYRLDESRAFPDPASRYQPRGPHGPSAVIDPSGFEWTDREWRGARLRGQVFYEMHVGTFTREGTWSAAAERFADLASLGITAIEVMPVADFSGSFGWGYDGVDLFAPTRLYGTPDDFRRFVDRAHARNLAVVLDVVYNHFGPDGAYLGEYSPHYHTDRYANEWGEAINFDGARSVPVRELFVANAGYWIDEFHVDGLRLDATQQMFDASPVHVLREISERVRRAGGPRATLVIAENEPQDTRLVKAPSEGGYGLDALWNDDFHHSARVAVTGRHEAYYRDYRGTPQELVSCVKRGYLYQGQRYGWQNKRRGAPTTGVAPATFVSYVQNHDQIANSPFGERLDALTTKGRYRAITALLLLAPGTPLLFQGQEFAASSPFLFFADHKPELAAAVREGRARFIGQFASAATPEVQARLPDPSDVATFERCKLDWSERARHGEAYALHRDLLQLRREDAVFGAQRLGGVDGAVLAAEAFVLRFFDARPEHDEDRLLVVNLGPWLDLSPVPEPLLAPPPGASWRLVWSSEDPRYGGAGTPAPETDAGWSIPANAALVLRPEPESLP